MSTDSSQYDYIIVGAGPSGCVVAHRLHQAQPTARILMLEAGDDAAQHDLSQTVAGFGKTRGSELDWSYDTTPQPGLGGRVMKAWGGKGLSGSGAINACGWTRAPACELDHWADITGDRSWGWSEMLPYYKKIETYDGDDVDPSLHGTNGPLKVNGHKLDQAKWPLHDHLKELWQSSGIPWNKDINSGYPLGLSYPTTLWTEGKRQYAHLAYDISQVEVRLLTPVHKVVIDTQSHSRPTVTGIQTINGEVIKGRRVILSAGVYISPKLLLLSGIGPMPDLNRHGIEAIVPNEQVGQQLRDDLNVRQVFKVSRPDVHFGLGSPLFKPDPSLLHRLPIEHFAYTQADEVCLKQALEKDIISDQMQRHLMHSDRVHQQTFFAYMALMSGTQLQSANIQQDGSYITSSVYNMAPTSRGSVKLASADPKVAPIIDPNYNATEIDRAIIRDALRRVYRLAMFPSNSTQPLVKEEVLLSDHLRQLTPELTDEEIDARVLVGAESGAHPSGTCGIGRVVDSRLRVFGVDGLRVIDASIFPDGVSGLIQATVYAVAEKAADMILEDDFTEDN